MIWRHGDAYESRTCNFCLQIPKIDIPLFTAKKSVSKSVPVLIIYPDCSSSKTVFFTITRIRALQMKFIRFSPINFVDFISCVFPFVPKPRARYLPDSGVTIICFTCRIVITRRTSGAIIPWTAHTPRRVVATIIYVFMVRAPLFTRRCISLQKC